MLTSRPSVAHLPGGPFHVMADVRTYGPRDEYIGFRTCGPYFSGTFEAAHAYVSAVWEQDGHTDGDVDMYVAGPDLPDLTPAPPPGFRIAVGPFRGFEGCAYTLVSTAPPVYVGDPLDELPF